MIRFDMDHCALVCLDYYMKRNSVTLCHSFVKAYFGCVDPILIVGENIPSPTHQNSSLQYDLEYNTGV